MLSETEHFFFALCGYLDIICGEESPSKLFDNCLRPGVYAQLCFLFLFWISDRLWEFFLHSTALLLDPFFFWSVQQFDILLLINRLLLFCLTPEALIKDSIMKILP